MSIFYVLQELLFILLFFNLNETLELWDLFYFFVFSGNLSQIDSFIFNINSLNLWKFGVFFFNLIFYFQNKYQEPLELLELLKPSDFWNHRTSRTKELLEPFSFFFLLHPQHKTRDLRNF